jgi:hypothetical protein
MKAVSCLDPNVFTYQSKTWCHNPQERGVEKKEQNGRKMQNTVIAVPARFLQMDLIQSP